MQLSGGNAGWWRLEAEEDLPGPLYLRLTLVDGQPRVTELYLDGGGQPVTAGALRSIPLAALEQSTSGHEASKSSDTIGPDLSTLASYFSTAFGSQVYAGRHCESCSAPLRGSQDVALTDWVAMSWLAQNALVTEVPAPAKKAKPRRQAQPLPRPRLHAPTAGLTDEFLRDVARAYRAAVDRRMAPAKTLAELAGVEVKTVNSWCYKARKRGLMPAATQRGRIV